MSLNFTDASSDNISIAAAASHNSLTTWTAWCWVYPTSATTNNRFWQKQNNAGGARWAVRRNGTTAGRVEVDIFRSTTFSHQETDDFTLNAWQFMVATYDEAAGQGARLYRGTLTSSVIECTYVGTAANGSGNTGTVDGAFTLGNRSANDRGLGGRMAHFGFVNRVLTLAELQALQFKPRVVSGTAIYIPVGYRGTSTQVDWSGNGNSGTVTGTTVAANPPLAPTFGQDSYIHRVTAAATFNVAWNSAANSVYQPGAMAA